MKTKKYDIHFYCDPDFDSQAKVYTSYLYIDKDGHYTNSGDPYGSYKLTAEDMEWIRENLTNTAGEPYNEQNPFYVDEWFTSSENDLMRLVLPPKALEWVESLPEYEIRDEREDTNAKLVR